MQLYRDGNCNVMKADVCLYVYKRGPQCIVCPHVVATLGCEESGQY